MTRYSDILSHPFVDEAARHSYLAERLWLTIYIEGPDEDVASFAQALTTATAPPTGPSVIDGLRIARLRGTLTPMSTPQRLFCIPLSGDLTVGATAQLLVLELTSRWPRSTFVFLGSPRLTFANHELLIVRDRDFVYDVEPARANDTLVILSRLGVPYGVLTDGTFHELARATSWDDVLSLIEDLAFVIATGTPQAPPVEPFANRGLAVAELTSWTWVVGEY